MYGDAMKTMTKCTFIRVVYRVRLFARRIELFYDYYKTCFFFFPILNIQWKVSQNISFRRGKKNNDIMDFIMFKTIDFINYNYFFFIITSVNYRFEWINTSVISVFLILGNAYIKNNIKPLNKYFGNEIHFSVFH